MTWLTPGPKWTPLFFDAAILAFTLVSLDRWLEWNLTWIAMGGTVAAAAVAIGLYWREKVEECPGADGGAKVPLSSSSSRMPAFDRWAEALVDAWLFGLAFWMLGRKSRSTSRCCSKRREC